MEVILTESVINLGNLGDVVQVANGYFRNYLGPQKKAMPNNKSNQADFKSQLKTLEKRAALVKKEAGDKAKKLNHLTLTIKARVVSNDKIYGSISINQINVLLKEAGVIVPKNAIVLNQAIRYLGSFQVNVKLHPDIEVTIPLKVVSDSPIDMDEASASRPSTKAKRSQGDETIEVTEIDELADKALNDKSSDTSSEV
jgi:large subunit ribosomal protein L9